MHGRADARQKCTPGQEVEIIPGADKSPKYNSSAKAKMCFIYYTVSTKCQQVCKIISKTNSTEEVPLGYHSRHVCID